MVVVALGDPGVPVICWASTGATLPSALSSPTARRKSRTTMDERVCIAGAFPGCCLVCYGFATENWQSRRLTFGIIVKTLHERQASRALSGPARRNCVDPLGPAHGLDRCATDRAWRAGRPSARRAASRLEIRPGAHEPASARVANVRAGGIRLRGRAG